MYFWLTQNILIFVLSNAYFAAKRFPLDAYSKFPAEFDYEVQNLIRTPHVREITFFIIKPFSLNKKCASSIFFYLDLNLFFYKLIGGRGAKIGYKMRNLSLSKRKSNLFYLS